MADTAPPHAATDGALGAKIETIVARQAAYAATGIPHDIAFRREQLRRLRATLKANEQRLFDAIALDMGKSPFEAYLTELGLVYHEIDQAIAKVASWSRPKRRSTGLVNWPASGRIIPEPLGVTLVIGAWNYPYQLTLAPLVAAMSAGNTCIVKPSELPVHTSAALAAVLNSAFDPAYLHVVEGGIAETQALLACHFDKIFFTGSTSVGRIVAKAAAEHLTPVTLELGGKSPCFVFADADIVMTARRLMWAKLINAGQTCIAPDYVLAERPIYEALLAELVRQIPLLVGPDPKTSDSYIRVINGRNLDRLRRLIYPAKTIAGGEIDPEARYLAPTILRDVDWDAPVMQEEIFGPILPVLPFDDINATIARVKARPKPLSLYAFTRSRATQKRLLDAVSFGGGCINDAVMHISATDLPFGGVGASGMGSYHAEAGFRAFSHMKSVLTKPFWFEAPIKYPPHRPWKAALIRRLFG